MTKPKIEEKYFYNKDSKVLYKVTNSKYVKMWYKSKNEFGVCSTSARNILDGYYANRYTLVDERNLSIYK